jgi:hypothetical protein
MEYGGCSVRKYPSAALGDGTGLDDLGRREGRAAEGADLSLADKVGERRERLLDVGRRVGPVDLVQVDPVGPQPPEAVLDLPDDPAPRVAPAIGAVAHREMHLGGEDDLVAPAPQRLPHDLLGLTCGVHIRGVDEIDALIERSVDDADAVVVVGVSDRAEHHGAEAVRTYLDTGAAQSAVAHGHASHPRS